MKKVVATIDCEPRWTDLWRLACSGHIPVEELEKACVLADTVRQAQKNGESITINPDNSVVIDDHKEE